MTRLVDMSLIVAQLNSEDIARMHDLLDLFAEAFDEPGTYTSNRPADEYLRSLLAGDTFIALVALERERVVGGLAAYELKKFEQARSEIYVYDLAVGAAHRRQGIATRLLRTLCEVAKARRAHVVFVQADYVDAPAVALYTSLGKAEAVLHFDLAVDS